MKLPYDRITLERRVLATLFGHATAAAWIVGLLDERRSCELFGEVDGRVHAMADTLCEMLGTRAGDRIALERSILDALFDHAAAAAWIVGQFDAPTLHPLFDELAGYIDATVHTLCEMLGAPSPSPGPSTARIAVAIAAPIVADTGDAP